MFSNIFKRSDGTEFEIRVSKDEVGEPWFVAVDVCRALSIGNSRQALSYLDEDEKGVTSNDTPGGDQRVSTVNEPGLYSLILRSRKPEAKAFKRWVTHEVLPSIRKTGSYQTDDPLAAFPDYVRDAFVRMAEENKVLKVEVQELSEELEEVTPLAQQFKEFTDSEDSASCRDAARLLNLPERQFTGLLREWGWIEKWGTAATAKSRSAGWMVNKVVQAKYGARPVQGRLTGKGFETATQKISAV